MSARVQAIPGSMARGQDQPRPDPYKVLDRICKPESLGDTRVDAVRGLGGAGHSDYHMESLLACDDVDLPDVRQRVLNQMTMSNVREIHSISQQGEWVYNQLGELKAGIVALYELVKSLEEKAQTPMTTEEELEKARSADKKPTYDQEQYDPESTI